ncbi:MAG: substrate-binding domain-containing protein [Chloroflexi bacterium]|nr:substrate-binding domain-containing protein [Chloroflexota bacterium]
MKKTLLGIVVFLLTCFGCASMPIAPTIAPTATPTIKPDLNLIARDYPRVDGSTSTKPLHIVIACKAFGLRCVWQEPIFSERTIAPDLKESLRAEANKLFEATQHTGTNPAYMNLINGKTDLILVARAPSEDELNAAKQNRVELDARPFALDAFVFLVNVKNPVDNLTITNVRDVYTGKITDWATLGGKGTIKAYQRDRNSGSQELMDALVMRGTPMIQAPDMIIETMMGAVNAIGRDPQGVGYSVYYYATFMLPDKNVKLVGVNGIKPTSENIATRAYPLTAPVYVVTRKNLPGNSSAAQLRDWLLTAEGKAAIAESGYVPFESP